MHKKVTHPLAITMWDFSWLERRWPGAGYEDWEQVLDELKDRGYDAIRIDVYPHLLAEDPDKQWILKPCWNQQTWGSPALNKVVIKENLIEFLKHCLEKNIQVGLSTWFREDIENTRMKIKTPEDLGYIWKKTLDIINDAGLMDSILYVDLCNEYPLDVWAPWLHKSEGKNVLRASRQGTLWMKDSINYIRNFYPNLDYCFSVTSEYDTLDQQDVSFMDILEPHIWMTHFGDFYEQVGYNFERFESIGYENVVANAETLYKDNPTKWQNQLKEGIDLIANWGLKTGKPLITTECWAIVDYKDWPLLNWDWIKELCEIGVKEAASKGCWVAIGTSNFCGPQFVGMWRDIEWHRNLTDHIHRAEVKAVVK
jgi:hypothetical protein